MKQGYLAKYRWILGDLSLDTLQSIIGYFFGAVFCCLFLLSPDAFSHYKLNQLTVSQKPYRIG